MDVEVAIGFTHASAISNGYWYQKGFEHDLKLDSPSFNIGISQPFLDRYRFRAGYEWLGRFTSSAAATASDANYNKATHTCNGECWPLSHWRGAGTVQGIYAAVARELFTVAGIPVSIELGGDYYRSTWRVDVPDYNAAGTCTKSVGCYQAAPHSLSIAHHARWQFTPQAGLSMGPVALTYRRDLSARGDEFPAIYQGSAWSIDYRFLF